MSSKIFILLGLVCISQMTIAAGFPNDVALWKAMFESESTTTAPPHRRIFATDLFKQISKDKINENVIISPISIQAAMAMAYMGAEGETAFELKKGLKLRSNSKDSVGRRFSRVLTKVEGDTQLSIANKIYVNSKYQLRLKYNDFLQKYFNSEAETLNFSQSANAVETINSWIEKATNNKITNIMQPGSVDGETSAVIVNAIYFKGKWAIPFSKDSTRKGEFWVSKTKSIETDTMHSTNLYKYGDLPNLDATAIEMSYKDSDLSMLIILPNDRDGLAKLEEKLSSVAINQLSSTMNTDMVEISIPKFEIEFSTSVIDALKAMGIRLIFGNNANLSGIFKTGPPVKVSNMQHKAFINVNEAGSEAAAATTMFMYPRSSMTEFNADHPFVFAIKSPDTVYFVGHIVNF